MVCLRPNGLPTKGPVCRAIRLPTMAVRCAGMVMKRLSHLLRLDTRFLPHEELRGVQTVLTREWSCIFVLCGMSAAVALD